MGKVTVKFNSDEINALRNLAKRERRAPREQAANMVVHELERAGLLPTCGKNADAASHHGRWETVIARIGGAAVPMAMNILIEGGKAELRRRGVLP